MATEKMAEAIRRFAADTLELEKVYRNGICPLQVPPFGQTQTLMPLPLRCSSDDLRPLQKRLSDLRGLSGPGSLS